MARDPVDRVLNHNMSMMAEGRVQRPYDPTFNPNPEASPPPIVPYDPNQVFNGKDFGRPATGDGK
jgi:hypothetical protein